MSPTLRRLKGLLSPPPAVGRVAGAALLFALAGLPAACGSGSSGGGGGGQSGGPGAPTSPPPESLSLDLSISAGGLDLDAPDAPAAAPAAGTVGGNYLVASADILAVNGVVAVPLLLPVALLRAAASQPAVLRAERTWIRSFDAAAGGRTWTANLQGVDGGLGALSWSLRVSTAALDAAGCCRDFELITGQSGGGGGTWQLHDVRAPARAQKVLSVNYVLADGGGKALTFLVSTDLPAAIRLGGGSRITYKVGAGTAELDVDDSSASGKCSLAWSLGGKSGSETQPGAAKVCWGDVASGYADVVCP